MDATQAAQALSDSVLDSVQDTLPIAVASIAGVGAVAFLIKAVFVAWRTGSKAVGKTGS